MTSYVVAWCIVAAIGVVLSLYLIVEAIIDLRSLGVIGNGRRIRTRVRLISEVIRLIIHLAFLGIGIPALNSPVRAESVPAILILLGGNVGLIINSLLMVYVTRLDPSSATVAKAAAADLMQTAEIAAQRLLDVAAQAAAQIKRVELERGLERGAVAAEKTAEAAQQTAENTAEIAENTRPENGSK